MVNMWAASHTEVAQLSRRKKEKEAAQSVPYEQEAWLWHPQLHEALPGTSSCFSPNTHYDYVILGTCIWQKENSPLDAHKLEY